MVSSVFSKGIHVRIDITIDTPISKKPMTNKFEKEVHLEELTQMRLNKVLVASSRQHRVNLKDIITPLIKQLRRHTN